MFQYGPSPPTLPRQDVLRSQANVIAQQQHERASMTATVSKQQPPPPPYSQIYPSHNQQQVNQRATKVQQNVANRNSVAANPVIHPKPAQLQHISLQQQLSLQQSLPQQNTSDYAFYQDPNNNTNVFKQPFPHNHNHNHRINNQSPHTHYKRSPRQSPQASPLPSPTYERRISNPYVWTKSNATDKKTVDLDLELPRIMQRIKENPDASYQNMIKETRKNKPLIEIRKTMVNDRYLSDVQFIVEGKVFFAHKLPLITSSSLFFDHFEKNNCRELKIDSIGYETFHDIITYCYTEQLKVTEGNVLDLMMAANLLQVRQITNICSGFIVNLMNPVSIFTIFEKALLLNSEVFKKKCLDYIKKNEEKCFSSKGFNAIHLTSLISILEACDYPAEKREEIIEKHFFAFNQSQEQPTQCSSHQQAPPKSKGGPNKTRTKNQPRKKQPNAIPLPMYPQHRSNSISDLMSLHVQFGAPFGGPPTIPPFPFMQQNVRPVQQQIPQRMNQRQVRTARLINIDNEDDTSSIINKDDEIKKLEILLIGPTQKYVKPSSRIDFVCNRSMMIHAIRFSENLALSCKWIKLSVTVIEGDTRREVRSRLVNINAGENDF